MVDEGLDGFGHGCVVVEMVAAVAVPSGGWCLVVFRRVVMVNIDLRTRESKAAEMAGRWMIDTVV